MTILSVWSSPPLASAGTLSVFRSGQTRRAASASANAALRVTDPVTT
jgi:hypothetical protein